MFSGRGTIRSGVKLVNEPSVPTTLRAAQFGRRAWWRSPWLHEHVGEFSFISAMSR